MQDIRHVLYATRSKHTKNHFQRSNNVSSLFLYEPFNFNSLASVYPGNKFETEYEIKRWDDGKFPWIETEIKFKLI